MGAIFLWNEFELGLLISFSLVRVVLFACDFLVWGGLVIPNGGFLVDFLFRED